jgi:AcrR family transcriptional regulator
MRTSPQSAAKSVRPYHHGDLRRALLDEALATIRKQGVSGLTLREIGARVGVSRTALYRHFADKAALLTAVATEGFRTLRQHLLTEWDEGGQNRTAFQAMGGAYISFAVNNPSHYRVMFGSFVDLEERDPELAVEAAGAFQALVDALARLQHEGFVRGDDTVLMARFVWSVVHGVAMLSIDNNLGDSCGVGDLTQYAVERIGTGIYASTSDSATAVPPKRAAVRSGTKSRLPRLTPQLHRPPARLMNRSSSAGIDGLPVR